MSSHRPYVRLVPTFFTMLAIAWACAAWGQSATSGALAGTVKDASGAAIPQATVTLSNYATGQEQTVTTGAGGSYEFTLLAPGSYGLKFSALGFKPSQAQAVAVNLSEVATVDAVLERGDSTEVVACECHVAHNAASASGTLVDSRTITAVPLTTRNFTQVLSMASGSAADVNNAGTLGAGSQSVNVNGNTTAGTYTVDGAASGNTVPNPDTISEFKIQTSQYDAGYGAKVPNTNLMTRSGQNEFHGDAWEFVRNDIFNANAYFRNAARQARPNLKQNQFGGTLGGPIRKNRLFFFGSYQGTRQVNGLDPSSLSTLILPPLTNDRSAATLGAQFCPGNKPAAVQAQYLTFAGGTQVACDGSNINPAALTLLQRKLPDGSYLIPTPQTILTGGPNAGRGFSSYSLPSTYREDQYIGNVDYVISPKHTLSGRFYYAGVDMLRSFGSSLFASAATPMVPGAPEHQTGPDYIVSGKLNSVLSSNLANEARMTFTRSDYTGTGPGTPPAAAFGMAPTDPLLPLPPEITVQGALGTFKIGNGQNETVNLTDTYSWADNVSWVHGRQTLRFGGFFYTQFWDLHDTGPARGKITIQNFTDFLLGMSAAQNGSPRGLSNIQSVLAYDGAGPQGEVAYYNRNLYGAAFVQDDLKVNSRLTLNLGLRWEYVGEGANTRGNIWPSLLQQAPIPPASGTYAGYTVPANYDPNTTNPYTGQPFGALPAGVLTHATNSLYQNGTPLDTFAPRLGFAWQPGGQNRVSLRGGYGWFYQPPSVGGNAPGVPLFSVAPFAEIFANTGASNNLSTLQKPFPTTTLGYRPRTVGSQLTDRIIGPEYKVSRLQQWNLNAQFGLLKDFSLDVGYVGSYGDRLLLAQGLNQPLLASGAGVNCGLPNTASGLGVSPTTFASLGINPAGCVTTNTSANSAYRVPILGETPTALLASQFLGLSWYHSMQATLRKQLSHGLTFQFAYTYSKAESDTTVLNDQTNLNLDWARASFDRKHRVFFNYNYELPVLAASGWQGKLLSGWSLSGILIVQSGLPMTLTDRNGGSVYGFAGGSTVTLCPGATTASLATSGSVESRLNRWINTAAVCPAPAIGSDGSTGYGNVGASVMDGPGQFNTDFSLGKTSRVGGLRENAQLAFRVEFYNALNHPQFSNPGTTFGTANFGVITQTAVAPRLIQFGLKYLF